MLDGKTREEWRKAIREHAEFLLKEERRGYDVWENLGELYDLPTPNWPDDDDDVEAINEMVYDELDKMNVTVTWDD